MPLLSRYFSTASARRCESRVLVFAEPVLSVWPPTSSSTACDALVSLALPVAKLTPLRTSEPDSPRMRQPFASTLLPGLVLGHLSLQSATPSWRLSRWHAQPALVS